MNFLGKVEIVSTHPDRFVRTVTQRFGAPAVVRLLRYHRLGSQTVRFSRRNIYLRDRYHCQYCATKFSGRELTLDHVIPKAQGGKTTWDNVVAACERCNRRKGNKTPKQASMPLLNDPQRPSWLPTAAQLGFDRVPEVWKAWLPDVHAHGDGIRVH